MGIIIREFECADCNHAFESSEPIEEVVCPQCAGIEAERVYLTAPGYRSPKTATTDTTVRELAADFGLSDVSNKDGQPVKRMPSVGPQPQFAAANPQTMQMIQKLGANADGFSSVLPSIRKMGNPRQWSKTREKR